MNFNFSQLLDLKGDSAPFSEIRQRIASDASVKGANLVILITTILIASVGLNMNSTAVIIGAMLISPLMGGWVALSQQATEWQPMTCNLSRIRW